MCNSQDDYVVPISVPAGYVLAVEDGAEVTAGRPIAKPERRTKGKTDTPSLVSGTLKIAGGLCGALVAGRVLIGATPQTMSGGAN